MTNSNRILLPEPLSLKPTAVSVRTVREFLVMSHACQYLVLAVVALTRLYSMKEPTHTLPEHVPLHHPL